MPEERNKNVVTHVYDPLTQHPLYEKPVDRWCLTFKMFYRTVEAHIENHADLQLGGYDRSCFEGLSKRGGIANAGHRTIEEPSVDKIGKLNDGSPFEFRDAISFKELVKILNDFVRV